MQDIVLPIGILVSLLMLLGLLVWWMRYCEQEAQKREREQSNVDSAEGERGREPGHHRR